MITTQAERVTHEKQAREFLSAQAQIQRAEADRKGHQRAQEQRPEYLAAMEYLANRGFKVFPTWIQRQLKTSEAE